MARMPPHHPVPMMPTLICSGNGVMARFLDERR
jgi:hypothetical protein